MITQNVLKNLLNYDPKTGIFVWKNNLSNRIKIGDIAGSIRKDGYITIRIDGKAYLAHRLAYFYIYGKFPKNGIDHIDGNMGNNRIDNLREANQSENMQNIKMEYCNNHTGFLGVGIIGKRYISQIGLSGKRIYLGCFKTPEQAHDAYLKAKRKLHPCSTI
jgi:HNH endonuclease